MNKIGLSINKQDASLDKVTLASSELKLLASGDGVEVMLQELNSHITFDIYPADLESTLMEFFYVLEGEIEYLTKDNEDFVILSPGDYFYTKYLTEPCVFKTLTNVKILYISSQPIFHYLGESLQKLHRINEEINQKDKYTKGHCERVQDLALKIALEMHLNRDRIARLAIAALFHDLGKIYLADDILCKPEKLTKIEFDDVKNHPIHSANYVNEIKYIDVSDIVLQHHERIDGSGYPYGLKQDDICIEAKIIAVADTYDAMTSDRPYRKALDVKKAISEIVSLSGIQYDTKIVESFVNIMKRDGLI